ncbi:exodeoxyribonuclease III [Simiduia aestuariiviva]|uniref:Exodeoxyribonuclease-3 n=1 Tax=Simiduia aestuariiviva TaxID=1510459 RepID=A0A839USG1_9GAMM|nr:exodeoxyribonuclease III [Simiduia aestuariiviva]MBB3168327.1 exodeoxyribonuclease-3 [Simiduia aestuariiviva]
MKSVISFNINSLRARLPQLQAIIDKYDPDFIGLQETKVQDKDFPEAAINDMGYQVIFHGQKTHYGVALLSKQTPERIVKGFLSDTEDAQRRFVGGCYSFNGEPLWVYNGYFPQGENESHEIKYPAKRKFYADLMRHLEDNHSPSENIIVMGDINISPTDLDIGIGEPNRKRWLRDGKCSFLPEEREWLDKLLGWGLIDSFRRFHPDVNDHFSWFDYRSRGFEDSPKRGLRIDAILCSAPLIASCVSAGIDYEIRAMEKPSDHAPIFLNW